MIYFTKYANKKFEILNNYKVFITKETVEEAIKSPDKSLKKGKYIFILKDRLKIIIKTEGDINKVITFFPVK